MDQLSHEERLSEETKQLESAVRRIYGALRSRLNELPIQDIRNTAAAAGFDIARVPATSEARSGSGSRAEVMPALDRLFGEMPLDDKTRTVRILATELFRQDSTKQQDLRDLLEMHGYEFRDGSFVPRAAMDSRERAFLPPSASEELARAADRIATRDYSGAITSACGAVDSVMQLVYQGHSLGDPGRVSFQAKVNTAAKQLRVFEDLERELVQRGVEPNAASELVQNAREATNHAAQVLQVLRRTMGDAHGSKGATSRLAYDAVKWAAAICGLFEGRV